MKVTNPYNLSVLTRVVQGYDMYRFLPMNDKLTGLGLGNIGASVKHYRGEFQEIFADQEEAGNGFFYDFLALGLPQTLLIKITIIAIFSQLPFGIVHFVLLEILRNGSGLSITSNTYLVFILLVIARIKIYKIANNKKKEPVL